MCCARHHNGGPISITEHHPGHPVYRPCVVEAAICIVRIVVREVRIPPDPHFNKLQALLALRPVVMAIYPIAIAPACTIAMRMFVGSR